MALIKCLDCEREVSDAAPSCPHCGRPMAKAVEAVVTPTRPAQMEVPRVLHQHHHTGVIGAPVVVQTQSKSTRFVFGCLALLLVVILAVILLPLLGVFGGAAALVFSRARERSHQAICQSNLRIIDGAKATWALEAKKTNTETPYDDDLFGPGRPAREKPVCPAGGVYSWTTVKELPTCSIPGHTI